MSHHLKSSAWYIHRIYLKIFPFLIICPVASKVKHDEINLIIAAEIQQMMNNIILNSAVLFHQLFSSFNFDDILALQSSYYHFFNPISKI